MAESVMQGGGLEEDRAEPAADTVEPERQGPEGLGGWLVLVGLGLIFTSLGLGLLMFQFPRMMMDGTWGVLTTPGSDSYHPLWGPLLFFELASNSAFMLVSLVLLVLFFLRSRRFPKIYVIFLLAKIPVVLLDAWLGSIVLSAEQAMDPEMKRELWRTVIGAAVWVPYMLDSKRVRNTFVR